MRFTVRILAVALVVTASTASDAAAKGGRELTPFLGFRSSGLDYATGVFCIRAPCPHSAGVRDDWLYGGSLRLPLNDRWKFELLANRQVTDVVTSNEPVQVDRLFEEGTDLRSFQQLPTFELRMTVLQAGLVRSWRLRSFAPYVAAGVGITRLDTASAAVIERRPDGDELSLSFAAGLDVPIEGRFGLRLESRVYSVDLPAQLGGRFVQAELVTGVSIQL